MKAFILGLLAAWSQAYDAEPFWVTVGGVTAVLVALGLFGATLHASLAARARISAGPILLGAAVITLGLCLLWTLFDGVAWWLDSPLLSERLLRWLAPDELRDDQLLRAALGLGADPGGSAGLLLPAGVTMTLGLILAGTLYLGLAAMSISILSERIALELEPDDVIRDRLEKARKAREERERATKDGEDGKAGEDGAKADGEAGAATDPDPEHGADREPDDPAADEPPDRRRTPLPDDLFGRLYKLAGHFTDGGDVEARFSRWQGPLSITMFTLVGLAVLPASLRTMPVTMWVGLAILASALRRLVSLPAPPEPSRDSDDEDADKDKATEGDSPGSEQADDPVRASPAPPPTFAERAEVAALFQRIPGADLPAPAAPEAGSRAAVHGQRLLSDITRALGVDRLHGHQRAALVAFDGGHSVVLCTAPDSGRELLCDALVLYTLLADAERVLVVCPDPAAASTAEARFRARAEATHWKWNILAVNLADRAGHFDPSKAQPALVFADPEAVHRVLCGQSGQWQTFLAGLGAVLLPDITGYSGVTAAHLSQVMRRLVFAAQRAAAAGTGIARPDPGRDDRIRFVATADPGAGNLARYVERITGDRVTVIGPERDDAPRARRDLRMVWPGNLPSGPDASGPGDALGRDAHTAIHGACHLARRARAMGYAVTLQGYDRILGAQERGPDSEHADVVIARMAPETHASLPAVAIHHRPGARAKTGAQAETRRPSITILWQPDRSPLAEWLARENPSLDSSLLGPGPALVVAPESPGVERHHLRCTLAETGLSVDRLRRWFSRRTLARELGAMRQRGQLVVHHERVLDRDAGAVRPDHTVAMATAADVHAAGSLHTTGESWQLCERSTGETIAHLEGERALTAAYPHRILVARDRRFEVLGLSDQDQLDRHRILAEPIDGAMMSAPIRRLFIEVIERRKNESDSESGSESGSDSESDPESGSGSEPPSPSPRALPADRRRATLRTIGGVPFSLQRRDVTVTEIVDGVRRFDLRATLLDSTLYEQPIVRRFDTRATLLGFPPGEPLTGPVSLDTLHALVHGFREALGAFLRWSEEDLDIAPLAQTASWSMPTIAFVDLHPGGAGFSDAIDLSIIRRLLQWTHTLLRDCPERCENGCPSCLHIPACRAPSPYHQRVDKAGAGHLLGVLLSPQRAS